MGQATRADGKPVVEEYELFNSAVEGPVQPSTNPSVFRATDGLEDDEDEDLAKGKPATMLQKAVSAAGYSSDSFVSVDSQDLS